MVETHCSNFRIITPFLGVSEFLGILWYMYLMMIDSSGQTLCRPRSDFSFRSILIRVYMVCFCCIFWMHYCVRLNYIVQILILQHFWGVRMFSDFNSDSQPRGRFGRKSLPELVHFSLLWVEGEVSMYRTYREIQNLYQNFSLKMMQNFSLSESSRLSQVSNR